MNKYHETSELWGEKTARSSLHFPMHPLAATASSKRPKENGQKQRTAMVITAAAIVLVLVLMPISKISRTDRISTSQTRIVAQTLCPPPIVVFLESGSCHITLIEHLPNLTSNARITVYDQNNSVVYQSSKLEEEPYLVKHDYNFTVDDSGTYNITLENAGVFFAQVETITTTWENVVTYPFESLFYLGMTVAAAALAVTILSLLKR